jgi:hypothetical protein
MSLRGDCKKNTPFMSKRLLGKMNSRDQRIGAPHFPLALVAT